MKRSLALLRGGLLKAAAPVLAVAVPADLLCAVVAVRTSDASGYVVNGDFRGYGDADGGTLIGARIALCALLVVHALAVTALAPVAAGLLLGKPVSAGAAMRRAVRPGAAVVAVLALLVPAAIAAGGVLVADATGRLWAGVLGGVVAAMPTCWALVAWPLSVLERGGPLRTLARTWTLTRHRRGYSSWNILVSLAVPAGVGAALWAVSSGARVVLFPVLVAVVAALAILLQAAVLAIVALNQWYPTAWLRHGRPIDLAEAAAGLPAGRPVSANRPRSVALGALALVIPVVLYGGYLFAGSYGPPAVSDQVVDGKVGLGRSIVQVVDGVPVVLSPGRHEGFFLRACADRPCRTIGESESEPDYAEQRMGAAAAPGGSLLVAVWRSDDAKELFRYARRFPDRTVLPLGLHLLTCTVRGCPADTGPAIAVSGASLIAGVDVAATGTGALLATVAERPQEEVGEMRLLRCTRLPCTRPDTLFTDKVPTRTGPFLKAVAVTTGRNGRPVAVFGRPDGTISIVTCDGTSCRKTQLVGHTPGDSLVSPWWPDAVDVAVPPDDRPLITYRDRQTGSARLLRCRTPACAATDSVGLSPTGVRQAAPAIALDSDGRALIATYDAEHATVVLIRCKDAACTSRDRTTIGSFAGLPAPLDLAVDGDGRAHVLWTDFVSNRPLNPLELHHSELEF
ncbi:hypothetical protein [Actinomadura chokoriensis]|uniref:hypothetical protein n=1 Tax=Actinomadura chokoriensis TaxID=454156 RepID=UPI0031F88881